MANDKSHPYLQQIPLTVSPYVSLPKATTLPYTYKSLPSTLPPSSTGEDEQNPKPKFVVSQSGHAAHPDDIIASCHALQEHLQKMQEGAEATLKKWQGEIQERELAEKRRVAPGWLDREEKILQPSQKASAAQQSNIMDMEAAGPAQQSLKEVHDAEGEALDRAFGPMAIRPRQ